MQHICMHNTCTRCISGSVSQSILGVLFLDDPHRKTSDKAYALSQLRGAHVTLRGNIRQLHSSKAHINSCKLLLRNTLKGQHNVQLNKHQPAALPLRPYLLMLLPLTTLVSGSMSDKGTSAKRERYLWCSIAQAEANRAS